MVKSTITLASGKEMPLVGFGLWKVPKDTAADTVYNVSSYIPFMKKIKTNTPQAIKAGYRLFDGAYDYQNEKEAGEGIQRAIADGLVTRAEVFITTKLWNNYHRREHAIDMAKKQNDAWGLGYIDLFLMHFPCALKYIDPAVRQYPVSTSRPQTQNQATEKHHKLIPTGMVDGRRRHRLPRQRPNPRNLGSNGIPR